MNIFSKNILIFVSLCASNSYAMDNPMQSITEWKQVAPFAGNVVAYTATTNYLDNKRNAYQLSSSSLNYGYVSNTLNSGRHGGIGYNLYQLLKKEAVSSNTVLTDDTVNQGSVCMRHVTPQEAGDILAAIRSNEAIFVTEKKYVVFWNREQEK